ncbi:MAG: class II D-tagatose-bisphosphate aldolase non-catalytic subunit [Bacteroidota bacterium]
MNKELRKRAADQGLPLMDYILKRMAELKSETGIPRTIFAACPNSAAVIKASLRAAKRANAPIKFAATLNQVDTDGGYTGLTQKEFVDTIREQCRMLNFTGPVIVAVDHGGPWLKDSHRVEKWPLEKTMNQVKASFEAALDAGYDLIHVDPTVDISLAPGSVIDIDVVAERTLELIAHTENYRKQRKLPRVSYEVGTEEVHGGLADMKVFNRFLTLLKKGLAERGLEDVWPCFIVGKVGTDLHTTFFDPEVAGELTLAAAAYGSYIKGHYSDNVENPEAYPLSGMGAANVGPEFTEREYDGLMELAGVEMHLKLEGKVARVSRILETIRESVIASHRWEKWLAKGESSTDFSANSPERQLWLTKTCARYIWENPEVVAARSRLMNNVENYGINGEEIVLSKIETAMDRYFYRFNLVNLNELL